MGLGVGVGLGLARMHLREAKDRCTECGRLTVGHGT